MSEPPRLPTSGRLTPLFGDLHPYALFSLKAILDLSRARSRASASACRRADGPPAFPRAAPLHRDLHLRMVARLRCGRMAARRAWPQAGDDLLPVGIRGRGAC